MYILTELLGAHKASVTAAAAAAAAAVCRDAALVCRCGSHLCMSIEACPVHWGVAISILHLRVLQASQGHQKILVMTLSLSDKLLDCPIRYMDALCQLLELCSAHLGIGTAVLLLARPAELTLFPS
jgi:hypothetical protein